MTRGVVIADDLTGAADTGVMFAKRGLRTVVLWNLDDLPDADVWVYSTESRNVPVEQAFTLTQNAARCFASKGVDWVYKKVDSTLRGHPREEFQAVWLAFDKGRALIAPAFPSQGRITKDGKHFVNGTLLRDSEFGREAASSHLGDIFDVTSPNAHLPLDVIRQDTVLATWLTAHAQHSLIADAETDADLAILAQIGRRHNLRIWCGSAGLAQALGATYCEYLIASPFPPAQENTDHWFGEGILVVAASQHPATQAQVRKLAEMGLPIIAPSEQRFNDTQQAAEDVAHDVLEGLKRRSCAVLTTTHLPFLPGRQAQLVARLGEFVREVVRQQPLRGLVLTGGDTAVAVIQALGARGLVLRDEIEPGVPWGQLTDGCASGMPVVTKAGGFGQGKTLQNAIDFLDKLIV